MLTRNICCLPACLSVRLASYSPRLELGQDFGEFRTSRQLHKGSDSSEIRHLFILLVREGARDGSVGESVTSRPVSC